LTIHLEVEWKVYGWPYPGFKTDPSRRKDTAPLARRPGNGAAKA
jgi:hypothetical protein